MAHQLPGDAGSISSIERLSPRSERPSCASTHRQYIGGLLHQPPRGSSRRILLWTQEKLLSLKAFFIPGYLNQGANILSRQGLKPGEWMPHTEVVEQIWKKFGRAQVDLFVSRETSQCPLWFSLTHPTPLGLDAMVADVAETSSVCLPPDRSAPGSSVRALDTYVHRADLWRKSDQLFVCYGPHKKGITANKQTLRRWIVDAITTAYESSDLPSPLGVRAHSIRSMVASKALSSGTSLQDICDAVGWTTPLTFVRFFSLGLQATQGSSVLSA